MESKSPDHPRAVNSSDACGMRALILARDWAATPLGPVESWPQSLKIAVELILANRFAMVILWGRDLVQIYNDDFRLMMADKHPMGLGQPARECWPEVWHINAPIYERVRRGETCMFEDALYSIERQGSLEDAWFNVCYSPLRDNAGDIGGVLVTLVEVTAAHRAAIEQKRTGRMESRLAAIVESSDDAIISKNLDGIIQTWNAGAERMFGYAAEEAIGKPVTILMPSDRVDEEPGILARIRRGEHIDHYETVRRHKDGSLLDISLTVSPILDGDGSVVAASKIARDITEAKRMESVLHASEAQLRRASRSRDEFFAMLSHELRNPLAPIATTLQLMKLRAPNVFVHERGIIEAQVRHLTGLVDDLLDVARIASGKLELKTEPVEIAEVMAIAVETIQALMEERRQSLQTQVADGLAVSGDKRRLVQILVNLLTNAAKYSPRGSTIYLSAIAEDRNMVLRVRDEGQGIEPDLLPHVFELFTQETQAIDRSRGGLGLGLAIVRNLVELHDGSVEGASEGRGKGSEFTVRLPLLESGWVRVDGSGAEEATPPEPMNRPRTKVLIVDDYAPAAESLALLLRELGCRTRIAYDGATALRTIEEFEPDVALVDIGLPVIDGYEVARTVRATSGRERLPLVAITGYGQPADRARVKNAGFDEHLVKPLNAAKIGQLIDKLVAS